MSKKTLVGTVNLNLLRKVVDGHITALLDRLVIAAKQDPLLLDLIDVPQAFVGFHVSVLHFFSLVMGAGTVALSEVLFFDVALFDRIFERDEVAVHVLRVPAELDDLVSLDLTKDHLLEVLELFVALRVV